jgi:vacuolar-type H+-ATPase subunit D/Vma8
VAEQFERRFVGQGAEDRGWRILGMLPEEGLIRVQKGILHKYHRRIEREILEQILIPGLRRDVAAILAVLEERSREETFRLTRLKRRSRAAQA